ncbi:hypothetical protein COU04_00745 [bacterium (Candidatus Gribaldobacteria) CG10_big_fil_rev_8_21_14_0_10_33_41]|nr:MAG: hypothetical protein COU04_00745 [bacterium (Candidatus Gribaldobacteria) CG10_big_fil_rev_8_21_14_0_10_33_41]
MIKIFKEKIIVKIFTIFFIFLLVLSPFSNSLVRADVCEEWGNPYCKESDPSSIFQSRTCTREKEVCETVCTGYTNVCVEWVTRVDTGCFLGCLTVCSAGCWASFGWWCPACAWVCCGLCNGGCNTGCQYQACNRYESQCSSWGQQCHPETYTEERSEECSPIDTGESKCIGDWVWEKYSTTACQNNACVPISDFWQEKTNCAQSCLPSLLNQECEWGTYTCNSELGRCSTPYQSCKPFPKYTDPGIVCECNNEKGTVIKSCNGAGSCVNTEEICDVSCGAVSACQGKKPGDLNPENPSLKCCKGGEWLPKWKEVAP